MDDEPLAREGLVADLTALGVTVVESASDGFSGCAAILRHRPDVLFLDIEMPELDGFAMLERLEPEDVPLAIVFVTAYDAHALRAFEARALDYVMKPVAPERLRAAVERAALRVRESLALRDTLERDADAVPAVPPETQRAAAQKPGGGEGRGPFLETLVIRDHRGITIVPVDGLEWLEADTYYVRLHPVLAGARPELLRERMHLLEARLDPARFVRTHRSAIVRLDRVRAIRSVSRYEHLVVLASGAQAPLSRERRARMEAMLGSLRDGGDSPS